MLNIGVDCSYRSCQSLCYALRFQLPVPLRLGGNGSLRDKILVQAITFFTLPSSRFAFALSITIAGPINAAVKVTRTICKHTQRDACGILALHVCIRLYKVEREERRKIQKIIHKKYIFLVAEHKATKSSALLTKTFLSRNTIDFL